jgi:hypothetical protein
MRTFPFARKLLSVVALFALTGCPPGPPPATPPAPLISPAFSTQNCPFTVTITDSASGNVIFYTTDGSSPQTSPTKVQYQAPFTVPANRAETVAAAAGVLGQQNLVFGPTTTVNYVCGNVLPSQLVASDLSGVAPGPVTQAAQGDLLQFQPNVGVSSSANGQVLWCSPGTINPLGPCTSRIGVSQIDPINPTPNEPYTAAFVPPTLLAGTYNIIIVNQNGAFVGYVSNFSVTAAPKVSVETQRYNNQRTGANTAETILTTQNVGSPAFQKLYQINVDGQVYAQPLLVSNVVMNSGMAQDVLLVATMNNTLFAFAVDNGFSTSSPTPPQLLWKASFGTPVAANFMPMAGTADTCFTSALCLPNGNHDTPDAPVALPSPQDCCPPNFNINPQIGLLSTPIVITGEASGIQDKGGAVYGEAEVWNGTSVDHHLWSVNLVTGAIINNIIIAGTSPAANGSVAFNATQQMQRPALLAGANSHMIYVAYGSHADTRPWHGWIFGFQGDAQGDIQNPAGSSGPAIWTTTPSALGGSIWQGGSGLAEDDVSGSVYAMTGNGEENTEGTQSSDVSFPTASACITSPNLADSFVSLTTALAVNGCFAPADDGPMTDSHSREAQDLDVSSSGPVKIPGTNALIGGEKEGLIFVLNTASQLSLMQAFQAAKTRDGFSVQGSGYHHIHGTPVLWKNSNGVTTVYVWPERDYLRAFNWDPSNSVFDCLNSAGSAIVPCQGPSGNTQPVQISKIEAPDCSFGTLGCSKMPGGILSLSANGSTSGTAIVWASVPIDTDALYRVVPGILRAFNAENLQQEVWDSQKNSNRDGNFTFAKFSPPLVANGRVYMATFSNAVNVYGLCSSSPCPVATVGP